MSSENGYQDAIIIKRKRRRTAVDPCLGYYKHAKIDLIDSALEREADSIRTSAVGDSVQHLADQKDVQNTDSVEAVTSPLSESADVVTVEEFLRQQATSSIRRCTTTYSHKRRHRIQFSSDEEDEDQNHSIAEEALKRGNRSRPCGSKKQRKAGRMAFSTRIQRAAALSSVDPDIETTANVAPLQLVSHDKSYPVTPLHDKRAKLIDPNIPRRLDASFANKENISTPHDAKSRACRPFSQRRGFFPQFTDPPPAMSQGPIVMKPERQKTSETILTPLKMVPYEEHDEARVAIFRQKSHKMRYSGLRRGDSLPPSEGDPPPPLTDTIYEPSTPLVPVECLLGSALMADIHPHQRNENSKTSSEALLNLPEVLIPESSSSPLPTIPGPVAQPADYSRNGNAIPDLQEKHLADVLDLHAPAPGTDIQNPCTFTLPSVSQRPMRRIGTMLDGFRERARSILISQSQAQNREKTEASPPFTEGSVESRAARTRRSSSRRAAFSSPIRRPSSVSVSENFRTASSRKNTSLVPSSGHEGGDEKVVGNATTMPSVSAVLRQVQDEVRQKETVSLKQFSPRRPRPRLSRIAGTKGLWSELKVGRARGCASALEILGDSASDALVGFNSGFPVPNLFDLLESVDLQDNAGGGGAPIMLSPSV